MLALNGPLALATERCQPDSRFKKLEGHAMLPALFCILYLEVIRCLAVHTTMGI